MKVKSQMKILRGKEPEEMIELINAKCKSSVMMKKKSRLAQNKCVNLKRSLCFVQWTANGWIILMRWIRLRQGIHLRAYGETDPLREYQIEGFEMFEEMIATIQEEVAKYIMKAEIRNNLERQEVAQRSGGCSSKRRTSAKAKKKPVRKWKKLAAMILVLRKRQKI